MVRILVVTQVRILREGLAQAIESQGHCSVVGVAGEAAEAVAMARGLEPDIVLAESALAREVSFVRGILQVAARAKVLAFAVSDAEDEILDCAEAGAHGYVLQQASLAELIDTLHAVMRGELPCEPRIAAKAFDRISRLAAGKRRQAAPAVELPRRQGQILSLIEQGYSNKEIARTLNLAPSTVKNHVHSILVRMGVARRAQAAARMRIARP
jgi:two-component system nitrate/nitrite response regulator NarL